MKLRVKLRDELARIEYEAGRRQGRVVGKESLKPGAPGSRSWPVFAMTEQERVRRCGQLDDRFHPAYVRGHADGIVEKIADPVLRSCPLLKIPAWDEETARVAVDWLLDQGFESEVTDLLAGNWGSLGSGLSSHPQFIRTALSHGVLPSVFRRLGYTREAPCRLCGNIAELWFPKCNICHSPHGLEPDVCEDCEDQDPESICNECWSS